MNQLTIRYFAFIVASVAALLFMACRPDSDPTALMPVVASATSPTSQTGVPASQIPDPSIQILTATFAGIPAQNVQIDQTTRTISVKFPADYNQIDLKPTVTLTDNTTLVGGLGSDRPLYTNNFCGCSDQFALIKRTGAPAGQPATQYKLVATAEAPLSLSSLIGPLVIPFAEFTNFSIPVMNGYGNPPIEQAYIQSTSGGPTLLLQGTEGNQASCVWFTCDRDQANRLSFSFNPSSKPEITPGTYTLTLVQRGGRRLVVSQPVQLINGEPKLNLNTYFGYAATAGDQTFTINGYNLLGSELTGEIKALNGKAWPTKAVSSAPNGTSALMSLPPDLPPGYYALRLLRNGNPLSGADCLRFSVRRSADHPLIYSLNFVSCLAQAPVVWQRGTNQSLVISYSFTGTTVLNLSAPTDAARSYDLAITIPVESFPRVQVPSTLPPGQYRATLKTTIGNQTLVSEPFEQLVTIQ